MPCWGAHVWCGKGRKQGNVGFGTLAHVTTCDEVWIDYGEVI